MAPVSFGTGTFRKLRFIDGTTFRHGYGPGLAVFNTAADLPEYARINNVRTATTTSQTFPIAWRDPAINQSLIEFFNRGSQTVYAAFGGPGVVATAASTACPPNSRTRFGGLNSATNTHFAIMAASGTSEVNARAEQGLALYLGNAFEAEGGADIFEIEVRNCLFRDLLNGIKSLGRPSRVVVMDNDLDRIYGDIIAVVPRPGGSGRFLRNITSAPFCRSGIAENLNGDANDPHGDVFQGVRVAYRGDQRCDYRRHTHAGAECPPRRLQPGQSVGDNDVTPAAFSNVQIISETYIGGAPLQLAVGEAGTFPVADFLNYGITILNWQDINDDGPRVQFAAAGDGGSVYTGSVISPTFVAQSPPFIQDRNLSLRNAVNRAAVFPNLSQINTAVSRAEIEAALTTAVEGTGLGAVATRNAVDWTTTDPEAVIKWENVPSGAHWNALNEQATETLITFPLRKILNRRPNQSVSVGTGTSWRSVAADGTTRVQGWTTTSGTIQPGQFIQIRRMSAVGGGQTVTASVTINGFVQETAIATANIPTNYLIRPATLAYFRDTATVPADTNRITFRGKFFWPTGALATIQRPFAITSTGADLEVLTSGRRRLTVEDSTFAKMLNGVGVTGLTLSENVWYDIVFDIEQIANRATVTVNGVAYVTPFTVSSSGQFQTGSPVGLLAVPNGTIPIAVGVRCADLSVHFNGVLRKAISNVAATANADSWKVGGTFLAGP